MLYSFYAIPSDNRLFPRLKTRKKQPLKWKGDDNINSGWKIAGIFVSLLSLALPFVGEAIQAKQWEEEKDELKTEIKSEIMKSLDESKEA